MKKNLLILALSFFTLSVFSQGATISTALAIDATNTSATITFSEAVFKSDGLTQLTATELVPTIALGTATLTSYTVSTTDDTTFTFALTLSGTSDGAEVLTLSGTVYDSASNDTAILTTASLSDLTAPTLTEVTVIVTPGNSATPSYVFNTDEAGTITSSLGFSTATSAFIGNNTITFNTLADGNYSGETLTVTDTAGNSASLTLPDFFIDATLPIITITGEALISSEVGTAYTDQGATALDNIDGDITASIVTVGDTAVDINTAGTYVITYNVNDAVGNAALQVTRTLVVYAPDSVPPVIELLGTATISSELGTVYTDAGATASDNIDGDITASIVVNNPVDIDTEGAYTITYNVTDSASNPATQMIRVVTITGDVTAPVITLEGNSTIPLVLGSTYTDAGATALDNIDGVITPGIIQAGTVDTNTAGTYTITYNVSDAAGNAAVEVVRTITVSAADTTVPVITITGPSIISLEVGTTYTDAGATAEDDIDGDITASIVLGGDTVDVNTVGVYTITYNVTDAATNAAVEATRTVNIINDKIVTLAVSETTIAENESFTVSASISSAHSTDIVIDFTNVGDAKHSTDFKSDATPRITTPAGNGYGGSATQLANPRGIFVDNSGNLYVADLSNNRIQKFAPGVDEGVTLIEGLGQPHDVSVDASGNIYVLEQSDNKISKWTSDGSSLGVVAGGNGEGSGANQIMERSRFLYRYAWVMFMLQIEKIIVFKNGHLVLLKE